uniref:Clu domain-containing protein n=1 Tax=Esox lucius TaxID=8010 RepID=A0A6Q2XTC5_ESOLU
MKDKAKRDQRTSDALTLTNGKTAAGMKQEDDTSFPVKIQGAGVEPFELQVHGFWLVQEAVMAVLGREEVCPRSNLSLGLSGMTLDPLAELQSIKSLRPGATLRLVEEPYSPRSARVHLARVLELLRAVGPNDALTEGRSPTVLDTLTHRYSSDFPVPSNGKSLKRSSSNTKAEPANPDGALPEYILPGVAERPLLAMLPHKTQPTVPSFLQDLTLSCWNPPPGHRKIQGDFLYITVATLEGRTCDITSCPRGFFLNRSTVDVFDPRPASSSPVCHCLTDLLCHISPGFKQALSALRARPQPSPAEVMPTPYRTLSWLGPPSASHRNTLSRLGLDPQSEGQAPDWNEELQAARDLPQRNLEERLQRDRALLQVNSAFVWAVAQGAETVVDGCVEPISGSPDDPAFLWGGLFMSQGGAGVPLGGERGRRAAQRLELSGIQSYSDLEGALQGLHTLPTAVVDYRGIRLSAQGLAPGLEVPEQSQGPSAPARGVLYGVGAGPQESPHRRHLLELLAQAAKGLSLQRHAVIGPNGHQVPLFTALDAKGLLGADGRFYLLDLFRTLPADANYCPEGGKPREEEEEGKDGWPEKYQITTGLPKSFAHGLCRLRPELLQAFIQNKQSQFTQRCKERMEENGGVEECVKAGDSRGTDAVRGACKDVGSVSDIIFEMRFNPSVFSPDVAFPKIDSEAIRLQERLLREAAASIITQQIPAFIKGCLQGSEVPLDAATLKQALHQKGINLRYLGQLTKAISQSEKKEQLRHIMRLAVGEAVVRSARRIFNNFLQGVEMSSVAAAVSHFLCCLLVAHYSSSPSGEEPKKRSRRRGRGGAASENAAWSALTGAELWTLICQDAAEAYDITNGLGSTADHLVETYGLQKVSLLREFSLKTGIQLRLREYFFDNRTKAPIGSDDVLNVFPVVKHITMTTHDASRAFQAAQSSIQKGMMDQAYERLKEATYLFGRVCDDLNPEACSCLSLLARVAYLQALPAEARSVQLKAVVISERVLGFDHPNTIQQYARLAVYVFAGGEAALAQRCLFRARLLMLTVHGEDHPYTATLDSCLGLILPSEQAGQFLQSALKINTSFFGPTSVHTALSQHLLSQWMCGVGDYRSAMKHEKEALSAFTNLYGEDHPQRRCSYEYLRSITQQAVRVERSLRQGGDPLTAEGQSLSPSTETVLEQLALVTGIRTPSHSDRLLEFKQQLMKQREAERAASKAADAKIHNTSRETVNGEAPETSEREVEEAGAVQDTINVNQEELPEEDDQGENTVNNQTVNSHQLATEGTIQNNPVIQSGEVVKSCERDGHEHRISPEDADLMSTEEVETKPVIACIDESQTQNGGLVSEGNKSDRKVEIANEKTGSDQVCSVNGTLSTNEKTGSDQVCSVNGTLSANEKTGSDQVCSVNGTLSANEKTGSDQVCSVNGTLSTNDDQSSQLQEVVGETSITISKVNLVTAEGKMLANGTVLSEGGLSEEQTILKRLAE